MPELPELETIVRGIRPGVAGKRVVRTWLRHGSLYRRGSRRLPFLNGRSVTAVERIGKNALFRFRPSALMVINLGMTGRLVTRESKHPNRDNRAHLHARIIFDDGSELDYYDARRFGHFYVARDCDFHRDLSIGPDPFIATPHYLAGILRGRRAPIKALLLDQHIMSGIGNIYADEILFEAGVDPRTAGEHLAGRERELIVASRRILRQAITHGGSTIRDYRQHDGTSGEFQQYHAVYGRGGAPCVRCASPIERIVLRGRSTHFCPQCQRRGRR